MATEKSGKQWRKMRNEIPFSLRNPTKMRVHAEMKNADIE